MSRKITLNPVTRIEGHASVDIELNNADSIKTACFKVLDFRGFETFLQGMQVEMMPTITARICGTCPVTHHLASAKAVDRIFNATIPKTAILLRNLLNFGSLIHSHAVHLFALAGPDLLLGINSDPAKRNILGLVERFPDISKKALRLRSIGHQICEYIGGRGTHPVSMIPGGVASPLTKEKFEKLTSISSEALILGNELFSILKEKIMKEIPHVNSLPLNTAYLGTVNNDYLDLYDGDLRLRTPDGKSYNFSVDNWTSHIFEEAIKGSYGKVTYCKDSDGKPVSYRVGPLARLNCADSIDTPQANKELEEFRLTYGSLCHQTVMYHYARLIELLYVIEKTSELLNNEEILSENVRSSLNSPRNAVAHVEAPRGVLIHDYKVDSNAIVTQANLLVATQQNIQAINDTIRLSAEKFIDQNDEELLNSVEFGIRCYDPCLSCATHRVGEMKLDVVIRHNNNLIRRVRR
ncbi:MAG: Ni/Fe hydrogenase subunit alpha [Chitinispirillia bacterium]